MKKKVFPTLLVVLALACTLFGLAACGDKHTHDYTETKVAPTCTEAGYTKHVCSCGDSYRDNEVVATHTLSFVAEKAATCTEAGNTAYYECSVCHRYFSDENGEIKITDKNSVVTTKTHNYVNGMCTLCGVKKPTEGLKYITSNNEYAEVSGIGTATDVDIVIDREYEGLPVTSIGDSAFSGCSGFTSITIPETVTSISENAFYDCKGLASVYYEGTVDSWAQIDFGDRYSNPLYYAKNLYINNELLTEAIFTTATEINKNAFYTYTPLASVTIGSSVISIADHAFFDCYKLTSLTMGNGVKSIGEFAFGSCIGLNSVYYEGTIDEWVQIDFVQFDSNPLHLAHDLYINNELVTEANITTATEIKKFAFHGCTKLKNVTIGDSVTSIGFEAFYDCVELDGITIGNGVKSIANSAFLNCSGLKIVYYKGTEAEWNDISINNNSWYNDKLINATRYYYSETEPAVNSDGTAYDGNYWHYDVDGNVVVWKKQ